MSLNLKQSKLAYERACKLMPGGVNSPVRAFNSVGGDPIYFKKAKGSGFTDLDGNEYVDFCQSWGPLILGHSHPAVLDAVQKAMPDGLSFGATHEKEIELSELVLEAFPEYERVRFVNSGTEAVMTALRLARGVKGRSHILKFTGGYHGHSDGLLVKAGSGLATFSIASSAGVPEEIASTTVVAEFDSEDEVEKIFAEYGDKLAAVIIEPLPANNGLLEQRREFLEFLREICDKNGTLLIFDEVISGFRFKFGGYGQLAGVEPDMVTLGKIIGGGLPVGAVAGKALHMEQLAPNGPIYQAGTLSGNPLSLAAGIATLKELRDRPPYEYLEELGTLFDEEIGKAPGACHLGYRRIGSLIWLYMGENEVPRRADEIEDIAIERFNNIYWSLMERGFYLPPSAYEVLFLSSAHDRGNIKTLVRALIDLSKEANGA